MSGRRISKDHGWGGDGEGIFGSAGVDDDNAPCASDVCHGSALTPMNEDERPCVRPQNVCRQRVVKFGGVCFFGVHQGIV